jgi:hypothetical protein
VPRRVYTPQRLNVICTPHRADTTALGPPFRFAPNNRTHPTLPTGLPAEILAAVIATSNNHDPLRKLGACLPRATSTERLTMFTPQATATAVSARRDQGVSAEPRAEDALVNVLPRASIFPLSLEARHPLSRRYLDPVRVLRVRRHRAVAGRCADLTLTDEMSVLF